MIITICSSVSFYKEVASLKNQLERLGHTVHIPKLAQQMKESGNYDLLSYQEQFDSSNPDRKGELIQAGFDLVSQADAILVLNNKKHGQVGYVGPNVLMEMAVAFYLNKHIFLMYPLSNQSAFTDEIFGIQPLVLNCDLNKIVI